MAYMDKFTSNNDGERSNFVNGLEIKGFASPLYWRNQAFMAVNRGSFAGNSPIWLNQGVEISIIGPAINSLLASTVGDQIHGSGIYDINVSLLRNNAAAHKQIQVRVRDSAGTTLMTYIRDAFPANTANANAYSLKYEFAAFVPEGGDVVAIIEAADAGVTYYGVIHTQKRFGPLVT